MLEKEPPDADDPILKLDNVILAPHALCWTDQCFAGNGAADVKAVLDVQHGRVPRGVVNRAVLEHRDVEAAPRGARLRASPARRPEAGATMNEAASRAIRGPSRRRSQAGHQRTAAPTEGGRA